jgi:hypothetical protein
MVHTCFDGVVEELEWRCTIRSVGAETAVIWRDARPTSEVVALAQLTPRPDPDTWHKPQQFIRSVPVDGNK